MKISTKGRYGVRLMMDLVNHPDGPVFLKDIAKRQGISEKYLWQLVSLLKNAGMVNAYRGLKGGYMLAKDPSEITVKNILAVLEGSMCLVSCVDNPSVCKWAETCAVREIWADTSKKISELLASYTLETIAEKQKKKSGVATYSI